MVSPLRVTPHVSLAELKRTAGVEKCARVRERILALRYLQAGHTVPEAGQIFSLGETQLRHWVHRYNAQGVKGLQDRPRSGQPPKLKQEQVAAFRVRLEAEPRPADGVCALRAKHLQGILHREFGAEYTMAGTYFLLHRLGYSCLVPRPRHPKSDPQKQEEFKKNFQRVWRKSKPPIRGNAWKSGDKTKRGSGNKVR